VFVHKNNLGKVSAFALCFFAMTWSTSQTQRNRIFWAFAFILGAITLVGSRSVTALVVVITMAVGLMLLRVARLWRKVWPVFFLIILVIGSGLIIIQNSEVILDAFGRDISLTGRVPLWQVLISIGLKQPLGFGYGAFWLGWNGPSAEVWAKLQWFLPNAHNGFLQLWLDLGWVGLVLGIIFLVTIFINNFGPALAGSTSSIFWILFGIIFVTYNLIEVNFFDQNNIFWVLIAYSYFSTQLRLSEK
jgi:exopolysaccharide production protein ExoQ